MTDNNIKLRLSVSLDFLKSFSRLPVSQQRKTREFLQKFESNPSLNGINYEKINGAIDSSLRSVRIDNNYRAIIANPQKDNLVFILWVDKHDDAYHWATRKRLLVNPNTGALQLIQVESDVQSFKNDNKDIPGLFDDYSDDALSELGVPSELLPRVRSIVSEEDLVIIENEFPQEVYNALFLLACGDNIDNIKSELAPKTKHDIDTSDYWKALDNDISKSRFTVIDSSIELQSLLNYPLDQWRVFLHPVQRKLVKMNASGPVRVLGSAGTGKTVVAIHRAKWLVENIFNGANDRILFTTFTKNLALDIRDYLKLICSSDILKRIEVINIDAWASNYLKNNKYRFNFCGKDEYDQCWNQALSYKPEDCSLTEQFFKDEWTQIIQPQDIFSLADYFKASRIGRGRRLNRNERKAIWPVFEEFRMLMKEANFKDSDDIYRDVRVDIEENKKRLPYKAIIVDEGQDLSLQAFRMLRSMVPEDNNDLFIVGDTHQRIYGYKNSLSAANINIRGRGKKLRLNYRTTEQTYRFATAILKGLSFDDLDGNDDPLEGCQSLTRGPEPEVQVFSSHEEEKQRIFELIQKLQEKNIELSNVCLTCRTKELVEEYQRYFNDHNLETVIINNKETHRSNKSGIRLATMHRIKGIEFDYVIIASACEDIIPLKTVIDKQENDIDRELAKKFERSLLYVALTRARKRVFVTGYGTISSLLPTIIR